MHELEENKDSVPFLINKLCLDLLKEHENILTPSQIEAAVPRLKAQSYEILLYQNPRPRNVVLQHEDEDFVPQRALDIQIFAAKLNARGDPQVCARFEEFEEQLESIKNEPYFNEGTGKSMLWLLLELQGNVHEENNIPTICPPKLLVPGPFTLHANYVNNPHYPIFEDYDLMNPKPKFFKGITPLKSLDNPYLPGFLFEGEKNLLHSLSTKSASNSAKEEQLKECSFTGMTKQLLGSAGLRFNTASMCLPGESSKLPLKSMKVQATGPPKQMKVVTTVSPEVKQKKKIFSWNWESLGCFGLTCSKPFASDANISLILQSNINKQNKLPFKAYILKQEDFIRDLKSLTVGIQSDTFQHDELLVFTMKAHVTIEGVLPTVIKSFVTDFLECGTCYKRLQTMIMRRDYKLMFEGFMFKALCNAIDEYLLTFRQFVFAKKDEYAIGFFKRMQKMMKQIVSLCCTLAIHPDVDPSVKPPMGSQFVGYLYEEIMHITQEEYIALLVFILKKCCHAYFKRLQKWIYYGVLDDPSNELFIGFMDHYREHTKYFYDKAYFIRKESVPGFFQDFDDQILQCGKYTMLLKTCKPNHALFSLEYPSISVCLAPEDILGLQSLCGQYFESANKVCARPISIREVFDKRRAEKSEFFKRMVERSKAQMERWTGEQHELALIVAEKKRRRFDELTAQLQDAKQRKALERRASVELELKYLREMEKLEDQRLINDNINLRKRLEYYQELSDQIAENLNAREQFKVGSKSKSSSHIPVHKASTTSHETSKTSASSHGTEFASCCDDDDEPASEYEECVSDDFALKFAESEKDLNAICEDSLSAGGDNEDNAMVILSKQLDIATKPREIQKEDNANTVNVMLKRSISDVINSNELPLLVATSLEINRKKAMGSTMMNQCLNPMSVNVTETNAISQPSKVDETKLNETTTTTQLQIQLTEAQRNKQRVMDEEFSLVYRNPKAQQVCADVNLNTIPENELTDLQRNRRRMMRNDLFSELNKDPMTARSNLHIDLNSERFKNRQKVLASEYNILTGEQEHRTNVNKALLSVDSPLTPMSTTSDLSPIAETTCQSVKDNNNGNLVVDEERAGNNEKTLLKLNVSFADNNSVKLYIPTAETAEAMTPESALNTAGIMAKQGFAFPHADKQQQDASVEAPVNNQSLQLEEACPEPDYNDPAKRCRELIDSNFKCQSYSPFIRINRPNNKALAAKRAAKAPVNVTTLTEFLQKSFIVPMSTHLQLVNNEVMRMFLQDLQLLDHFRSLRNYYFMMDGEFGSIICDGIIGKLESGVKPEKLLNYQILHSILDAALGSSITGKDRNSENLSFIVDDVPEKFDINSPDVLSNLSLSYRLNWPLNLILNPETLEQYANIFKYLIRVRRISWILERAYQILKECVKQHGSVILKSPQYRHVQFMRHKFYHFVHTLQNHITANALQASWKTFKDTLITANTIEDIYRKHTTYIKRILFLCMLNRKSVEFYNTIENVFRISIRFYNNLKSREFKMKPDQQHFTHSRYEKLVNDELEFDKFMKYTIYLGNKIVQHGYQAEIGEFIGLINYNQYYMKNI